MITWVGIGDAYGAAWQEQRQAGFRAFQSGDFPAAVEQLEAALNLAEETKAADQDLAILLENLTTAYLADKRYHRAQVSIHHWDRILTANEGRAWASEHWAVRDELASLTSKAVVAHLDVQVAPASGVDQQPSEQSSPSEDAPKAVVAHFDLQVAPASGVDQQPSEQSLPAEDAPAVYAVHLASAKARENAVAAWGNLKQHYPSLLAGKRLALPRVNLGERGIFFRVLAFPFHDAEDAKSVCEMMQQHEQYCAVITG